MSDAERPPEETPGETPDETPDASPDGTPDFGPSGYLPERAARRARKIVLRAPLGLQWVVGALLVGVVVAVAGFIALRPQAPGPPFRELPVEAQPRATGASAVVEIDGRDVLVVDVLGRTRAYDWASGGEPAAYCAESGLLEARDGRAWRATGRGLGETDSIAELPTVTVDGRVFVDPTRSLALLAPDPGARPEPRCGASSSP